MNSNSTHAASHDAHDAATNRGASGVSSLSAQISGGSGQNTTATTPTGDSKKCLVRKVIAIDFGKLRQVGLDRKIAEALGKRQKLATTTTAIDVAPDVSVAPTPPNTVIRKMVPPKITITRPLESPPTTTSTTMENLNLTEDQSNFNITLSTDSDRLIHAKSVLKQNLIMKLARNSQTKTTPPSSAISQTTTTTTGESSCANPIESTSSTVQRVSASTAPFGGNEEPTTLKMSGKSRATFIDHPKKVQILEPYPTAPKKPSPIKTPQEIARILDFSDGSDNVSLNVVNKGPPLVLNYTLPKHINQISSTPTIATTATCTFQDSFKKQIIASVAKKSKEKKPSTSQQDAVKQKAVIEKNNITKVADLTNFLKIKNAANVSDLAKAIDYRHLPKSKSTLSLNQETSTPVDDNIPKASIKASAKRSKIPIEQPVASSLHKSVTVGDMGMQPTKKKVTRELPIDFPDVSPLKQPFPSISIPGETPLPTISTFKKPFSAVIQHPPEAAVKLEANESYTQPNFFTMPKYAIEKPTEPFSLKKSNQTISYNTSSTNSLIVLENKVLSQDEKIDLAALRLANPTPPLPSQTTPLHSPQSACVEVAIKQEKDLEEFLPESITSPVDQINTKTINNKLSSTVKQPRKVILAADKLKLPPEKIAALAKQIQSQALGKLKKQSGTILRLPTKTNVMEKLGKERLFEATKKPIPFKNIADEVARNRQTPINTMLQTEIDCPDKIEQYDNSKTTANTASSQPKLPIQIPRMPVKVLEMTTTSVSQFQSEHRPQDTTAEICGKIKPTGSQDSSATISDNSDKICNKSDTGELSGKDDDQHKLSFTSTSNDSVEIMKEPLHSSISAVDFIASLSSSHPITAETTLELSPEELNLNASFAMNLSPIRIPYYSRKLSSALKKGHHDTDMQSPSETSSINNQLNDLNEAPPDAEFLATTDMFMPNNAAHDFGVEIGNIVTFEKNNVVSQLSPNAEGIITIPAHETDVVVKPFIDESVQKMENVKYVHKNSEHLNEQISEEINENVQSVITAHTVVKSTAKVAITTENNANSTQGSVEIVNQPVNTEFEKSDNLNEEIFKNNNMTLKLKDYASPSKIVKVSISNNELATTSIKTENQHLIDNGKKEHIADTSPKINSEKSTENAHTDEISLQNTNCDVLPVEIITEKIPEVKKFELPIVRPTTALQVENHTEKHKPLKAKDQISDTITPKTSEEMTAKKRISRFKKGTINLVQRKKSTASNVTLTITENCNEKTNISSNIVKHKDNISMDIEPITIPTKEPIKDMNELEELSIKSTVESSEMMKVEIEKESTEKPTEKIISQLINPRPMLKKKKALQEIAETEKTILEVESNHSKTMSLLQTVNMLEEPETFPPAQVPFKKSLEQDETKLSEEPPIGIKNLLEKLEVTNPLNLDVDKIQNNESDTINVDGDETTLVRKIVLDETEANETSDFFQELGLNKIEQLDSSKLTELIKFKRKENQALSSTSLYRCDVQDSPETTSQSQILTISGGHQDLIKDSESDLQCEKLNTISTPFKKCSTENSLTELFDENTQQKTLKFETEKVTNKQSINSINTELLSPSKNNANGPVELEFLPVTPPKQNYAGLCAESRKPKFPSQSSEDAEIYSSDNRHTYDEDEEIAGTAEESSQEFLQIKTIQRKRLRKSALDSISRQNRSCDTDSDDERNDVDEVDVEYQNIGSAKEFLGFDEISPTNSKMQKSLDLIIAATSAEDDSGNEAEISPRNSNVEKGACSSNVNATVVGDDNTTTMENWLTTGKTIAPTSFYSSRKMRNKESMIGTSRNSMPLKKRWDLAAANVQVQKSRQNDETDVTDDTSPADDDDDEDVNVDEEEEKKFQKLLRANSLITGKRSLQMLEEAQVIAAKKLKLSEDRNETKAKSSLNQLEVNADNKETTFLKPIPPTPPDEAVCNKKKLLDVPAGVAKKQSGSKCNEIDESGLQQRRERTSKRFCNDESDASITSPNKFISLALDKMDSPPPTTSTPNIPKKRGRKSKTADLIETTATITDTTRVKHATETDGQKKSLCKPEETKSEITIEDTKQNTLIEYHDAAITNTTLTFENTTISETTKAAATRQNTVNHNATTTKEATSIGNTSLVQKKRGRKSKVVPRSMSIGEEVDNAISEETTPVAVKQNSKSEDNETLEKDSNQIIKTTPSGSKPNSTADDTTDNAKISEFTSINQDCKSSTKETVLLSYSVEGENTPVVQRKRSRKSKVLVIEEKKLKVADPKSIIEYFETTQATESVEGSLLEMLQTDNTQPVNKSLSTEATTNTNIPKKRGRKPRIIPLEIANTSTVPNVISPSPPQPNEVEQPDEQQKTPNISKKRGRKPKNYIPDTTSETSQVECEIIQSEITPTVPKKRGRKPKVDNASTNSEAKQQKSIIEYFETHESRNSSTHKSNEPTTPNIALNSTASPALKTTIPKKRGRKPKLLTATNNEGQLESSAANSEVSELRNFNPRLLLSRNRAQIDSREVLTASAENVGEGPVQCGLCLMRMKRARWTQHLAEHYGVGWIVGEPELNIHQRSVVLTTMINYLKENQSKEVACRMCPRTYRSGLGMLMHIEACGVPRTLVTCEYCDRGYQSQWLQSHQRTCMARMTAERDDDADTNTTSNQDVKEVDVTSKVLNNVGRVKRASLMKAESKLKAIGEELVSGASAESIHFDPKNHIKYQAPVGGDQKSKGVYHCQICRTTFELEADVIKHVLQKHKPQAGSDFEANSSDSDVNIDEDDDGDDDDEDQESSGEDVESNDESLADTAGSPASKRRRPAAGGGRKTSKSKKAKSVRPPPVTQSTCKTLYPRRSDNCTRTVAQKWKEFSTKNYAKGLLYAYATPTLSKIPVNLDLGRQVNDDEAVSEDDVVILEKCLPSQRVSMKYAFAVKSQFKKELGVPDTTIDWSELKRFDTAQVRGEQLVFLGAPIKALAWAPLPSHVREQYLVVAYRKNIDKYTRLINPKITPTHILVYKILTSENDQAATAIADIQLLYAIHIPDGPVQCFAFLPSGGYDDDTNRLGLLAVGTSASSTINIYALPLRPNAEEEIEKENINERLTVIELKPALALTLDMELTAAASTHLLNATQCLQICWSESLSHGHIFASYSNGCIGIWDTTADDGSCANLNCFIVEDVLHFTPLNYFYVGEKVIRALAVHYDTTGPRWLAAACHSRKFIVYDIRDMTQPITVKEESSKNILRSMDWSVLWETPVVGFCDIVPKDGRAATAITLTGVIFNRCKMDNMVSAVTQIHYNPAVNLHACATDNGDIIFLNTRELYREDIFSRSQKNSRAISMMDIKCLDGSPLPQCRTSSVVDTQEIEQEKEAVLENDCNQKLGLVFGGVLKYKLEDKSKYLSPQRIPPSNLTSYMRVNSLRCNVNALGRRLVAIGYENGFLRIMCFNRDTFFKETG